MADDPKTPAEEAVVEEIPVVEILNTDAPADSSTESEETTEVSA